MAYNLGETISEDMEQYLQKIAEQDEQRNIFLKALVGKISDDERDMSRLKLDLNDQTDSRIRYQKEVELLRKQIAEYKNVIDKNAYVAVLVDGDGAVFCDSMLQKPIQGATEASQKLKQHIKDDLRSFGENDDLPIFTRVFANLHKLAGIMQKAGIIDKEDQLVRFSEHFTNSCAEFDFINVGCGKENADCKMRRMLRYYYNDYRCKRIYFAGCHDGGYSHDLREYLGPIHKPENRIVLVETTPAVPSIRSLGFPISRFDNVFRKELLTTEGISSPNIQTSVKAGPASNKGGSVTETLTPPRSPSPIVASPVVDVKTSGNGGISIKYPSYASAGGKDGHQNLIIQPSKPKKVKAIDLNKDNQRLDPPIKYPELSVQTSYSQKCKKISPKVFCNAWYLSGICSWGDECDKEHKLKLTADEIMYHRCKARTSACFSGPGCIDFDCALSHHCPQSPTCPRTACKFKNHPRLGNMHLDKASMLVTKRWVEGTPFPE